MCFISTRMITDSKTTEASKAPTKYFTQSGVLGWGDAEAGGAGGAGGSGIFSGDGGGSSSGGGLVVKALTALQAL